MAQSKMGLPVCPPGSRLWLQHKNQGNMVMVKAIMGQNLCPSVWWSWPYQKVREKVAILARSLEAWRCCWCGSRNGESIAATGCRPKYWGTVWWCRGARRMMKYDVNWDDKHCWDRKLILFQLIQEPWRETARKSFNPFITPISHPLTRNLRNVTRKCHSDELNKTEIWTSYCIDDLYIRVGVSCCDNVSSIRWTIPLQTAAPAFPWRLTRSSLFPERVSWGRYSTEYVGHRWCVRKLVNRMIFSCMFPNHPDSIVDPSIWMIA